MSRSRISTDSDPDSGTGQNTSTVPSVTVYFVEEDDPDEEIQQAFNQCTEHSSAGINCQWIEKDQLILKKSTLSKTDVVVFQEFKGKEFETISRSKAIVIGARCLSCCLSEGSEIPKGPHPIYMLPMRNFVVTCTGLSIKEREAIKTKVTQMAGKYSNNLFEASTHLIANNVFSTKYRLAHSRNIRVMSVEWVDAVWDAALKQNISGSDPRFDDYKIPIFYKLIITTTSIAKKEKKSIIDLINRHGGTFSGTYEADKTNIVVMKLDGIGTEKFICARQNKTPCVSVEWVTDSIEKGYALDVSEYVIKIDKTSSPLQDRNLPDFSLNVSNIPNIKSSVRASAEDSCLTSQRDLTPQTPQVQHLTPKKNQQAPRILPTAKECAQLVDSLDMKTVRQAGLVLDGCCIYVYNFTATRREKVHRIVSRAGGVRYDAPHEAITHAICGDPANKIPAADKSAMPRAMFVSVVWLVDSMKSEKPLEEQPYLVEGDDDYNEKNNSSERLKSITLSSPMSKKNLQLLKPPSRPIVPPPVWDQKSDNEHKEVDDLLEQYRSQQTLQDDETLLENKEMPPTNKKDEGTMTSNNSTMMDKNKQRDPDNSRLVHCDASDYVQEHSDLPKVFVGLSFELLGMEQTTTLDIATNIEASGGKVLGFNKGAEYVVVPIEYDESEIEHKSANIITTLWLDDCLTKEEIVPIEYYHKPVKIISNCTPLTGLVMGISTYCGSERTFIDELAKLLGAVTQMNFCRKETSKNKASTHLICPEPSGAKYEGALKWGMPAVTSSWLIECAAVGKKLREGPFLVGNTREPDRDESVNEVIPIDNNESCNKENDVSLNKDNDTSNQASITPVKDVSVKNHTMEPEINKDVTIPYNKMEDSPANNTTRRRTIGKLSLGGSDLSPASRFIKMAKLGFLGSQESPKQSLDKSNKNLDDVMSTPPMENALSTPNLALFSEKSRRRLIAIKRGEMPSDPPCTPKNPFDISIKTPDSCFGAVLCSENEVMSPDSRKKLMKFCEGLPEPDPAKLNDTKETPISEKIRGFCKRLMENDDNLDATPLNTKNPRNSHNIETPPSKRRLIELQDSASTSTMSPVQENHLKQLISILTGDISLPGSSASTPGSHRKKALGASPLATPGLAEKNEDVVRFHNFESQPDTVGWDDVDQTSLNQNKPEASPEKPKVFKFMLSQNITNTPELTSIIKNLGGEVLDSKYFDPSVTHMLCIKLIRSEKILNSIASGIWLLHPEFVVQSGREGKFIDEEKYEWGNPRAEICSTTEVETLLAQAAHKWRQKRLCGEGGPFRGMRFLLYVSEEKMKPLKLLINFGDGEIVEAKPPYSGDMNVTFCIGDPSKMPVSAQDTEYLISRRIALCSAHTIICLLTDDPMRAPLEYAFPHYLKLLNDK